MILSVMDIIRIPERSKTSVITWRPPLFGYNNNYKTNKGKIKRFIPEIKLKSISDFGGYLYIPYDSIIRATNIEKIPVVALQNQDTKYIYKEYKADMMKDKISLEELKEIEEKTPAVSITNKVVEFLKNNQNMAYTVKAISQELGINEPYLRVILYKLAKRGIINKKRPIGFRGAYYWFSENK